MRAILLIVAATACKGSDSERNHAEPEGCNGDLDLCERTLDQVTFPGTHNSMSNADAGWLVANQQHGLTRQLDDGIRALMLDTWEWDGGLWLCHGYCELGAQPLDEGLGEIGAFLDGRPREVVLVIFEDHINAEQAAGALEAAGLAGLAWAWDGGEVPTLGELLDGGTPLVLAAENEGPPPDWYHHAWDLFVDTPYDFTAADEFSCAVNRGGPASPLFLVNHWLSTPLPTQEGAAEVNAADVLGPRARQCEEEQGRPVNFLGVDFYDQGDLFEVVDRLNER